MSDVGTSINNNFTDLFIAFLSCNLCHVCYRETFCDIYIILFSPSSHSKRFPVTSLRFTE